MVLDKPGQRTVEPGQQRARIAKAPADNSSISDDRSEVKNNRNDWCSEGREGSAFLTLVPDWGFRLLSS